jgi:uncharacterized protein
MYVRKAIGLLGLCLLIAFVIWLASGSPRLQVHRKSVHSSPLQQSPSENTGSLTDSAQKLVDLLSRGDFNTAVANFDETMQKVLPSDKLARAWNSIIAQAGPFVEKVVARTEKIQQYDVVFVTCKFEKTTLDAKVVYNCDKQISGLFFVPSTMKAVPKQ